MSRKAKSAAAKLEELCIQFKALADPKRLLILNLLMEGVQCNCNLGDKLGMAPNLVSHHLSVLRQAGLIEMERDAQDGRWIYYSVNKSALAELTAAFNGFFDMTRVEPRDPTCGPKGCDTVAPTLSVLHDQQREAIAAGD